MSHIDHFLAALFGNTFGPDSTIIVIFAFVILITIIKQISRWQRDKLWHDTARMAMERNQPIPTPPFGPFGRGDMRDMWRFGRRWSRNHYTWYFPRGLVLMVVGLGLYLCAGDSIGRWWILPILVGGAQLLIGLIMWLFRSPESRDPFDPMNRPQ